MKYDIKKLEYERCRRGWNKSKVARLIDVDPAVIGRVERGENLNPVTIKKIADILEVDMKEVLIDESAA